MEKIFCLMALLLCTIVLFAQTKITGTVVDKDNQPLMGVQVMPEAGGDAVTTDFDGKFEITVPEGTKLTFSMLGAKAKTEVAADKMVVVMGTKTKTAKSKQSTSVYEKGLSHHLSVDLGYAHGFFADKHPAENAKTNQLANANGFHLGTTYKLDLCGGSNIPSFTIGLNYQMLTTPCGFYSTQEEIEEYKAVVEEMKSEALTYSNNSYRHMLQLPIAVRYTHNFNKDVGFFLYTGFQFAFVLAENEIFKYDFNNTSSMTQTINRTTGKYETVTDENGKKSAVRGEKDNWGFASTFDIQWKSGIGFAYKQFELDVSYSQGTQNYYNNSYYTSHPDSKIICSDLKVTLVYRFF